MRLVDDAVDQPFLLSLFASEQHGVLAQSPLVEMQFKAQLASYRAAYPHSVHQLIMWMGEAIGRIWVDYSATEIRLIDILIAPSHRNRGIGSHLIATLQNESRATQRPLKLSVYTDNVSAQRFYNSHAFKTTPSDKNLAHISMEYLP